MGSDFGVRKVIDFRNFEMRKFSRDFLCFHTVIELIVDTTKLINAYFGACLSWVNVLIFIPFFENF